MAFTAGKSKEIEGKSNDWLLDQSLMQSMQDLSLIHISEPTRP